MGDSKAQAMIKTGTGQAIGVGVGNALAYVLLEFIAWKYQWIPDDPAVFIVMVGTLMGAGILQLHRIGDAIKYVFDRAYPEAHDDG